MGIFRYLNPLGDGIDYFICLGCKHANEYHTEIRLGFRFAINVLKVIKFENLIKQWINFNYIFIIYSL